jgi:hypothetical protein
LTATASATALDSASSTPDPIWNAVFIIPPHKLLAFTGTEEGMKIPTAQLVIVTAATSITDVGKTCFQKLMSPGDTKQQGSDAMTHRGIPTRNKYLVLKRKTAGAMTTEKMPPTKPMGMSLMAVALGESLLISCAMRAMQ